MWILSALLHWHSPSFTRDIPSGSIPAAREETLRVQHSPCKHSLPTHSNQPEPPSMLYGSTPQIRLRKPLFKRTKASFVLCDSAFHYDNNGTCLAHQRVKHARQRAIEGALSSVTAVVTRTWYQTVRSSK